MDPCMNPECEARLAVLEKEYESVRAVADKAAADVVRIERDVDRIGSEMRRLRAVMVGSDAEENGGLRAEVQWLRNAMAESRMYHPLILWMLTALVGVLTPEQVIQLVSVLQKALHP